MKKKDQILYFTSLLLVSGSIYYFLGSKVGAPMPRRKPKV